MTQQEKEKMFLDLNSVLVKFWIEQGRPNKEIKIELLERMLNWYKKMGYVIPQSKEPVNEDLEESAWECVLDSIDVNNPVLLPKYKELLLSLFIAGAEWQKQQMLKDAVDARVVESFSPAIEKGKPELHGITVVYNDKTEPYLLAGDKVKIVILPIKED